MSNKTQFFPIDFLTEAGFKTIDGNLIPGLSTDVKPTENIKKGAVFYEMDTKRAFMFDGVSTWYEM